ncbi:SCO family protein [Hymenobacter caeli]|uniref:Protein SCO1/2 n=1 Tax=Hymenobacter caeli TaxID=2735894 RepID=A0ABX2FM02_9BACT|nr:SCO family protein [Hymenobacter caeli]NRT17601.1 protein SCO1/2 [Hymenobacter caeli]
MSIRFWLAPALAAALLTACSGPADHQAARLPILGERDVRPNPNGGPADTVYATAPAFRAVDQAGTTVTNQTFAGRAYVTDFFFATCPGICPKMQGELLKVFKPYAADPRVGFVSFTIDPAHDSLPVLRDYAQRLGVADPNRWHFVTTGRAAAARDSVFGLAKGFFTAAQPEKAAPGGFAHNGTFALVDDQGHVRGLYDSLNPTEVARLQTELPVLLAEIAERHPKATAAQ